MFGKFSMNEHFSSLSISINNFSNSERYYFQDLLRSFQFRIFICLAGIWNLSFNNFPGGIKCIYLLSSIFIVISLIQLIRLYLNFL